MIKSYGIPGERRFWSARMEFRLLAQRPNESIQDFSSRVMTLTNTCDWANRGEQIVCGIIFGAAHRDAQRKALLKVKSLTVRDCIEHFASYEATDAYHKTIVNPTSVSAVYRNCFNCGSKHSKGKCKAFGHVCRNCGRSHHFESVCMSKSEKSSTNKQSQHKPKYSYQNKLILFL